MLAGNHRHFETRRGDAVKFALALLALFGVFAGASVAG